MADTLIPLHSTCYLLVIISHFHKKFTTKNKQTKAVTKQKAPNTIYRNLTANLVLCSVRNAGAASTWYKDLRVEIYRVLLMRPYAPTGAMILDDDDDDYW